MRYAISAKTAGETAADGLILQFEEADVTYAGGFPEDYSDVFGAPAAALPAF
jgi:hypothetical protein